MSWFEIIPAYSVAALLFLGLGAPLPAVLRLRGLPFFSVAVATSATVVALASTITPILGVPWTLLAPVLCSAVLAALAFAVRRWLVIPSSIRRNEWGRPFAVQAVALGIGATLTLIHLVPGMGAPDHPSQSYDTVFHLNAVQWIIDTGDASPLDMTMTTPGRVRTFYPTTWHAVVALVVQLTGASVVVATNATMLVVASVVWTISCLFFARVLFGRSPYHTLLAGGFSATFGAFPAMLTWFGVLYPNLLAVSLLPIPLALLAALVQRRPSFGLRPVTLVLLALLTIAGMALAHPNALFSLFVLGAPLVVVEVVRRIRRAPADQRMRVAAVSVGAALALFAAIAFAFSRATPDDNAWLPSRPFPSAVREALMNAPLDLTAAWVLTGVVVIGAVVAVLRPRLRWLVASWLLAALLYGVAVAWPVGAFRTAITGVWYNDAYRLAVLAPVFGVPLAVLGTVAITRWLVRGVRRRSVVDGAGHAGRLRVPARVAMAVVGLLAVGISFASMLADSARFVGYRYALTADTPMLSDREVAFLAQVSDLVPTDAVIAGNPWNGSSLVYAYTGRRTVFPHVGGAYPDSYWALAEGLADRTPEACTAARDLDVTHILDFGDRYIFRDDPRAQRYPGLTDLEETEGVRVIAEDGELRLFEVDCS